MRNIRKMRAHRNPRIVQIGKDSRAPVQQNDVRKYTVFGSARAIMGLADMCSVALPDEANLEKIDEYGGHFIIAEYGSPAFEILASQYGLQVSEVRA